MSRNGGTPVTDYKIYWDDPEDLEGYILIADNTIPSFAHTVTGLTAALEYKFKVVATNIIGDSGMSVAAGFIASSLPEAPGQPAVIDRTDAPTIKLKWTAPPYNGGSKVQSYKIYVDNAHTGTVSGNLYEYTETAPALIIGVLQEFKVSAVNAIGEGPHSEVASAFSATVPY